MCIYIYTYICIHINNMYIYIYIYMYTHIHMYMPTSEAVAPGSRAVESLTIMINNKNNVGD